MMIILVSIVKITNSQQTNLKGHKVNKAKGVKKVKEITLVISLKLNKTQAETINNQQSNLIKHLVRTVRRVLAREKTTS